MESLLADKNYSGLEEVRRLYNASFPRDERIDFDRLIRLLSENRRMYVYHEDGKIIGMTYFFIHEDIAYMGYICVQEDLRNKGYGTKILKQCINKYEGYMIAIDIEEADERFSNCEERKRRREFYIRNGFESTGIFYNFFFVDYEILSHGGMIAKEEWQAPVEKHWGKVAKTARYR